MTGGLLAQATPALQALTAYDPGHDLPALRRRFGGGGAIGGLIELGSNENAWGPSPRVLSALANAAATEVWRYPDPLATDLRGRLAEAHGVNADQLVLGNGSHELLMQLAQIFCAPGDEVLVSRYAFAVYPIAAKAVGASVVVADAWPAQHLMSRGHDLEAMLAKLSPRTRLICLANPNNPTGTWVSTAALAAFLERIPKSIPVVVDEAYMEFADAPGLTSALGLRQSFHNLIVTRTFSKAYGLAGLRIGYAIAAADVIVLVNRLRESFNVNALALLAATVALADAEHLQRGVTQVRAERERVAAILRGRGLHVGPSQGNFLLIDFADEAAPIETALLQQGVVVRPMLAYGLPQCLRVTLASRAENDRFLQALTL